ncbi:MAG: hypothetical protein K0R54_5818 [Clostridiaceae bacterium]|jgi:hypothetical protein|nr:hypothetical protein [Clostridiaceae bacterium]
MKKISFKVGDLFAIPLLDGKYATGRILLCPKKQKFKKIIGETKKEIEAGEKDFPEAFIHGTEMLYHGGGILVEVYKEVFNEPTAKQSEVLIKGIEVSSYSIEREEWPIIGNIQVQPTEVEFPEFIVVIPPKRQWYFCRGEVWLPLPVDDPKNIVDWRGINIHFTMHGGLMYYISYLLGDVEKGISLGNKDLRYNDRRREVYELLNLPLDEPYYEFALRHGFDLARFYWK